MTLLDEGHLLKHHGLQPQGLLVLVLMSVERSLLHQQNHSAGSYGDIRQLGDWLVPSASQGIWSQVTQGV